MGDNKSVVGTLPFDGNTNEMAVVNAYQELYRIVFVWAIKNDDERFEKKSQYLIKTLLNHKGKGSLFTCLTDRGYA